MLYHMVAWRWNISILCQGMQQFLGILRLRTFVNITRAEESVSSPDHGTYTLTRHIVPLAAGILRTINVSCKQHRPVMSSVLPGSEPHGKSPRPRVRWNTEGNSYQIPDPFLDKQITNGCSEGIQAQFDICRHNSKSRMMAVKAFRSNSTSVDITANQEWWQWRHKLSSLATLLSDRFSCNSGANVCEPTT